MSLSRKPWLMAWGLQLLLIAGAHAQSDPLESDTDFVPYVGDVQLFDRPDVTSYGNRPKRNEGYFFKYTGLQWAVSNPEVTTVGREGFNPLTFDGTGFVRQPNSINTGFISARLQSGSRLELGIVEDCKGWLISTFVLHKHSDHFTGNNVGMSFFSPFDGGVSALESFTDVNLDGFDDDLNNNNVFGRDGRDLGSPNPTPPPLFIFPFDGIPDTPAATDFGDLVFLPVFFDVVQVKHTTRAWGIEVDRLWQGPMFKKGGNWEFFGGPRYLRFRDDFLVDARGRILDPGTPAERLLGVLADSRFNTEADNNLVGPQVGLRWTNKRGRFSLSAEGRFFAASNFQTIRQEGFFQDIPFGASTIPIQPTPTSAVLEGRPINLFPTGFQNVHRSVEFSPAAELRVDAQYQLFRSVALEAGFTYFAADGVARSSNMTDYQLPTLGILEGNNQQDLVFYGFNFGVSINR